VDLFGSTRVSEDLDCTISAASRMGKHTLEPSRKMMAAAREAWGLHFDLDREIACECFCSTCQKRQAAERDDDDQQATGTEG